MRKLGMTAAIALIAAGLMTGCDRDEFGDAPTVQAPSSEGGGSGGYGDQPGSAAQQEGGSGSAGPVQPGTERPPNHPTLQGDGAGQGGGAEMDVAKPQVDRPEPSQYGRQGAILWQAPDHWQPQPPSNQMRFAEYEVPGSAEHSAELTVFFFGPGPNGGGGVDANLDRWAGQFGDSAEATRGTREVAGMAVHTLDVSGTYDSGMGMGTDQQAQDDQRLLGAIAETSTGLFFFRLLGDRELVTQESDGFDEFVASFEDGSS